MKQKVYAYLVRGEELLVFDHLDFPEAGTQVPGGSLEPGESIEEGALRELFEEAGVVARPVRYLGAHPWWQESQGLWHERHILHLEPVGPLLDEWVHVVSHGAQDKGLRFRFFWILLAEAPGRLIASLGEYWSQPT